VPVLLSILTAVLIVVSSMVGIILTYHLTKRNYSLIMGVISIVEAAEKNEKIPSLETYRNDNYAYIINNIVKTFAEQNALRTQLAEKKYRMKSLELKALQAQINPHFLNNTLK
ncbi:MAG: histidine kinase, partial [Clostridiaceae bacterium]|nr:histidine kinase [Clostridiaceae bacterium]